MTDTSTGGTTTVKCKKGYGKVEVTVKDADTDEPIVGATVVVRKRVLIGKPPAGIELTTGDDGKARGEVKAGKYKLLAKAPGTSSRQRPKVPYVETPKDEIQKVEVKKGIENPFSATLKKVPRCKPYLKLLWKEHDGSGRAFPEGMPVELLMSEPGNSKIACKVGQDGLLVPRGGTDPLDFEQRRGPFKVRFPAGTEDRYVACEKKGASAEAATLVGPADLAGLGDKRFFKLPKLAFGLEQGAWTVTGDGGAWVADPKHWDAARDTIGAQDAPAELLLDPEWQVQPFLKLEWKDPDGTARPFPPDLHVDLLFTTPNDGKAEAKVGADGKLVARTGTAALHFPRAAGPIKVKFAAATEERYVAVEARGVTPAIAPALVLASGLSTLGEKRAFRLPKAAFGLELGTWTVADDGGTWKADPKHFDVAEGALGASATPAKLTVEMRWSFVRLVYQDRLRGGDDQVSVLPVFLEGYLGDTVADLAARSNWTIGDDADKAVQCLPWLVDPAGTKPDKASLLRFTTAEHTFIETQDSPNPRRVVVGEKATPNADRLRFYDLPKEWRSTNWFVRTSARTLDKTGGKFFFELATPEDARGTKTAPVILSLDDIVLYQDATTPLPVLATTSPVAVFKHTFAKGTPADANVTEVGLFRGTTSITLAGGQNAEGAYYPASEDRVLIRGGSGAYAALVENYIVEYPSWTRLVIAEGTLFDCFADRTKAQDGQVRVVGARAGVRWVDPLANHTNVLDEGNGSATRPITPGLGRRDRPAPTNRTFGTAQLCVGIATPSSNKRRDQATATSKGTAIPNTVTDLGPLAEARVGRPAERCKEWQTAVTTAPWGIGRWDLALLRCCGRKDDGTERAVLFQHHRVGYVFSPGPNPPASSKTSNADKTAFIQPAIDALHTRWNGPDGVYNAGRATIEPIDNTQAPGKLVVETLRFFQAVPLARAGIRATVVADVDGARDFMNSFFGNTQTQEKNVLPETSGWFTAAHEMGHGGGLVDDYCELWNHGSYNQPGIVHLMPGDPYMLDDTDDRESMMKANKVVRPRHFWHLAEWVHAAIGGGALQVKHGTATYSLPHHHRSITANLAFIRSYLSFCWDSILDQPLTIASTNRLARCDLYLYALGADVYADTVLPGRASNYASTFDAILVVNVHLGLKVHGGVDHDQMSAYASKITSTLRSRFGYRCVADVTVGTRRFQHCLIHISPRVLVGTTATPFNATYARQIGATFNDGDANNVKVAAHDTKVQEKQRLGMLHAILELGASSTGVVESGTELPRIKVEVADMLALKTAVKTLLDTIKTLFQNIRTDRNALHAPPGSPATYDSKINEAQTDVTNKEQERNALGSARTTANGAQWDTLTGELQNLQQHLENWKKAKALHDDYLRLHGTVQSNVVGRGPHVFHGLFEAATSTLDDPVWDVLNGLPAKANTASTQPSATKGTVRAAVELDDDDRTSMSPANALRCNLGLAAIRSGIDDLPPKTRPADAAAVVRAYVGLAKAIRDFADPGSDDAAKKARADQAKAAVKAMCEAAVAYKTKRRNDLASGIPGSYSEHRLEEWFVEQDILFEAVNPKGAEQQAKTMEEKLEQQFAAYLGLEVANTATGFLAFVSPFADSGSAPTVKTCAPPAPPPPPPSNPPPSTPTPSTGG